MRQITLSFLAMLNLDYQYFLKGNEHMQKLVCTNCGGNDFYELDGMFVCKFCHTRYYREQPKIRATNSDICLKDDVQRLFQKCNEDPKNARKYANLILDIDPTNKEALKYL